MFSTLRGARHIYPRRVAPMLYPFHSLFSLWLARQKYGRSRRDGRTTKTRERDSCAFGARIGEPIRLWRSSASCATRRSCGKVA